MTKQRRSFSPRLKRNGLMAELGLIGKQPDSLDIPNRLNRQFVVGAPNRVWCEIAGASL